MPRIIKFILFLLLFGIIFEVGLLSSYTIVTAEPPDVGKLMDMQISKLTAIWDSLNLGSGNNTANSLNVTNVDAVAQVLKSKTGMSGINIDTVSATITGGSVSDTVTVNLIATGYKENMTGGVTSNGTTSSGQIVIKSSEVYSMTATANAKKKTKGVEVDVNTIQITSLKKMYGQ